MKYSVAQVHGLYEHIILHVLDYFKKYAVASSTKHVSPLLFAVSFISDWRMHNHYYDLKIIIERASVDFALGGSARKLARINNDLEQTK